MLSEWFSSFAMNSWASGENVSLANFDMDWSGDSLNSGDNAYNETNLTNDSLSCFSQNLVNLPYSPSFINPVRVLQAIAYFLVFVFGLSLNSFVIFLVAKYKRLRSHSFGIAVQLNIVNILTSVVYLNGFVNIVANGWVFGEYACAISGMFLFIMSAVRLLLMFEFVVNRFLFVFMPFRYPKSHGKVLFVLPCIIWVGSLLASLSVLPPILDCVRFSSATFLCTTTTKCGLDCSLFIITSYIFITLPCTVVPTILYILLYVKARKLKKATATVTDGTASGGQRDWKATITFFILFLSLFAASLPSVTVSVILAIVYKDDAIPPAAFGVLIFCIHVLTLLAVIDPIVIMRNQDVREVLKDFKERVFSKCCARYKISTVQAKSEE